MPCLSIPWLFLVFLSQFFFHPILTSDLFSFYLSQGQQSSSNAFLSPQWGGIMICNLQQTAPTNSTRPQWIEVDMKPVMNTFLAQLKLLLGFKPVVRIQLFSILTDFYTFSQLTPPKLVSHMAIFVCSCIVLHDDCLVLFLCSLNLNSLVPYSSVILFLCLMRKIAYKRRLLKKQ